MHFSALTTLTTALLCATAQSLTLVHPQNSHDRTSVISTFVIDITLVTSTSVDAATAEVSLHPHNRHSRTSVPSTFITSASASSTAAETIAASTAEGRKGVKCPNAAILCPPE